MTTDMRALCYDDFVAIGTSGTAQDVDTLMRVLASDIDLTTSKLVDFALGLVDTRQGYRRIRYYLFQGDQRQRNYAALYFKRNGYTDLLEDAVAEGKIDFEQAYSK